MFGVNVKKFVELFFDIQTLDPVTGDIIQTLVLELADIKKSYSFIGNISCSFMHILGFTSSSFIVSFADSLKNVHTFFKLNFDPHWYEKHKFCRC